MQVHVTAQYPLHMNEVQPGQHICHTCINVRIISKLFSLGVLMAFIPLLYIQWIHHVYEHEMMNTPPT